MLVIRLRTISSETFSTCPISMSWTLPSCTCSPCRCLHSASIVSASSRLIVVCAEYVEQHQLICLLCVIPHVLLPCLFIALLSRLLFPRHLSIHISFFLSSTCSYSYAFSFLIFLPPLSFSLSIPPTYSPSLRSNHIVLVFSLPALALLFCLHFSHLIPFLSTCLTFLATLSRPFLLLFFLPPISCRAPSRLPCTSLKCSSIFRLYHRLLLTLFRFFPPILLSIFPFSSPPRPVGQTPIVNYRRVFLFLQ